MMTKPDVNAATITFDSALALVRSAALTPLEAANLLIGRMTDRELLWLLDGDTPVSRAAGLPAKIKAGPMVAGAVSRLGIPGVRFADGPRGVTIQQATAFPVTMARGATWDPELEREVGLAMGREARAKGANYSGAVCVNLLRHPAWGRAQESYGEDPVLMGRMGAGLTLGLRRNVMACVKHFALNSMENSRFKIDVTVDEHALHEVYLPHFKTIVDSGADSVMSAYNSVNGAFAGENKPLLTDILRNEWGFEGFVTSDWVFGTHDAVESLEAGLDVEMPLRMLRARVLPKALKRGSVARETVLRSARRIIATSLRHAAQRDVAEPDVSVVASEEHRALARRVAVRSAVLLKNASVNGTPMLPLRPSIRRVAVIGSLATEANTGDHGSSVVDAPSTSSPLDGLREAMADTEIVHHDGHDLAAAISIAQSVDAVIIVAGMNFDDEGERIQPEDPEMMKVFGFPFNTKLFGWITSKFSPNHFGRGGDRDSLTLHAHDEELINAVADANPRTAVVMIGGSAIITEAWKDKPAAILMAWYPGMEGGRAIGDVISGVEEPGGRLPISIATDAAHLPFFDAEADSITYDGSWGQRKLDADGNRAAFPFGFGLGYTTFEMELVSHRAGELDGVASVHVQNSGNRFGSTVVQIYAVDAAAPRLVPQLVGFQRVELGPGEETVAEVELDLTPTRERDPRTKTWSTRNGTWNIVAAAYSPSTVENARRLLAGAAADTRTTATR